jgi:hypothetical protein
VGEGRKGQEEVGGGEERTEKGERRDGDGRVKGQRREREKRRKGGERRRNSSGTLLAASSNSPAALRAFCFC